MATSSATWTESNIQAGGLTLQLVKGGTGKPLLILHDVLGHVGWFRFHEALAQQYTLHIPSHPGFGTSEAPEWIMTMRELAGWYLDALDDMGIGPVPTLGLGFGGWLAAEMAAMCPQQFTKLVLVSAPGIRPPGGEIYDMFLVVTKEYLTVCFDDPARAPEYQQLVNADQDPEMAEAIERGREMSSRLTWRPYMHYPNLPHLLRRLRRVPTLIVWGKQDRIVPVGAAEVYHQAIPGSQLVVLDQCGHYPELEQTDAFLQHVQAFLRA